MKKEKEKQNINNNVESCEPLQQKNLAEKFCVNLLRQMSDTVVSSFGNDAKVVFDTLLDEVACTLETLDTNVTDEIENQLETIPEYMVEKNKYDNGVIQLYYLKIEFFNCPAEQIRISNDVLEKLKQYYPHTRIFFVTPYDSVFYFLNVDDIKDGEHLDLKTHLLEDYYSCYKERDHLQKILNIYRTLLRNIFYMNDLIAMENV